MSLQKAVITGWGMAVPPRVVTNHDLSALMETSHEWIVERSGIEQRRFVDEGVGPAALAEEASRKALARAGYEPSDMDMIIVATLSPEHYFPGTGAFLQHRLGLKTTPAMDIRNQCSGFIYALNVASLFIATGQCRRILLCGTEVHSRALDLTTRGRDTAVLFGDGSGALVLEASPHPERGVMSCHLHSQGEFADKLWVQAPSMSSGKACSVEDVTEGRFHPQMDGRFVFKHAVQRLPEVVMEALNHHHLSVPDVDYFVFHQANLRINEKVGALLGIPPERAPSNIQRYGNCSAASIPMLLSEMGDQGLLQEGKLLCLAAFGAGFTWGSALIRW